MHVYTQEYSLNQNSNTLEPDRPQHDGAAACVISQQYSSADFVSLRFHSSKGKSDAPFKKFHYFIYFTISKLGKCKIA